MLQHLHQLFQPHQDNNQVLFWTNLNNSSYMQYMEKNKNKTWLYYLQKSEDSQELVNEVRRILGE